MRPPVKYTDGLKLTQIAERHLPGKPSDYEEDHYVPLDLGGNPDSPSNLWPQPIREARMKDKLESTLNRAVCGGKLTLAARATVSHTRWLDRMRETDACTGAMSRAILCPDPSR